MNQQNKTESLENIIDGVFLHGKITPEQSFGLPNGQYTVAEAINLISHFLSDARREERERCLEETSKKMDNFIDFNGETYMVVKVNRQALTTAEESIKSLK